MLRDALPAGSMVHFGPFRFDPRAGLLYEGDRLIRLTGRPLALLGMLIERPGEVVKRNELEARLWPETTVEDSNLRVLVAALRKVLDDGVDGRRLIANVPGRGYSLVAPVFSNEAALRQPVPVERGGRMPARPNSIIGRESAIASLSATMLHSRLTTIVGHGGIGKTTLALALADRLAGCYPDGCRFVDLAPLSDPAHVLPALAAVLGLEISTDRPWESLGEGLEGQRKLLLFDNCEHVLDGARALVEAVLEHTGTVDIIATSRQAFDLDGETVYRVEPLPAPPAEDLDCIRAMAYPAMQLLVERAAASAGSFELDEGNVDAAAAVCRCLDGVPLAIEFAAARIGLLGVRAVAAQLDDRLGLLGSGRRTALPRHRTLRALLAWSYDLLNPIEQGTFCRSAIFRGGFTLGDAMAVLADETLQAHEVAVCMPSLVGKSLVSLDMSQPDPEFALLSITRAFALERLDESDAGTGLARRHAIWVLGRMRTSIADWDRLALPAWRARYLRCLGDLRAAHDWAFAPGGDEALGVELTAQMRLLALSFMRPDEVRHRVGSVQRAIEAGTPVDPLHEMWVYNLLNHGLDPGTMCAPRLPGQADALADAVRANRVQTQIEVLYHMFTQAFGAGDYPLAGDSARRALALAARARDEVAVLHCERMLAQTLHFGGEHAQASVRADRVLERAGEKVPVPFASSVSRRVSMGIVRARIDWLRGDPVRAGAGIDACLSLAAGESHPGALCQVLALAACPITLWQGDEASGLIDRLEQHALAHGLEYWAGWARALRTGASDLWDNSISPPRSKLLDHLATFDVAWLTRDTLRRAQQGIAGWCAPEVLRAHGERLLMAGDAGELAEKVFLQAHRLAREQGATAWTLRAANSLARLWHAQGRAVEARNVLTPLSGSADERSADGREALKLLHTIAERTS